MVGSISKDERIAYGAKCTWWDSIDKVGIKVINGHKLPVCPICFGPLLELDSEAFWFKSVDNYEIKHHSGYRQFIEWVRGQCFPNIASAMICYKQQLEHKEKLSKEQINTIRAECIEEIASLFDKVAKHADERTIRDARDYEDATRQKHFAEGAARTIREYGKKKINMA